MATKQRAPLQGPHMDLTPAISLARLVPHLRIQLLNLPHLGLHGHVLLVGDGLGLLPRLGQLGLQAQGAGTGGRVQRTAGESTEVAKLLSSGIWPVTARQLLSEQLPVTLWEEPSHLTCPLSQRGVTTGCFTHQHPPALPSPALHTPGYGPLQSHYLHLYPAPTLLPHQHQTQ